MCLSCFKPCPKPEHSDLEHQNIRRDWTMWITLWKVALACTVHINCVVGPVSLIMELAEESNIIKFWTLSFDQKLKNSERMLFPSSMELFFPIHLPSVWLWMKNIWIYGLMIGPTAWAAKPTRLAQLDYFLSGFVKDQVNWTTVPSLSRPQRRITTAVITVGQEIINNIWMKFENLFHVVIRE